MESVMGDNEYQHLLRKARDAKRGGLAAWSVMSTGEKVAVALVLNRAEWLAEYGYTIPEAIDRTGAEWVSLIPKVARDLADEDAA
jgi:hypothetical protein